MTTYKTLEEAVTRMGLHVIETTAGANGYPSHLQHAIIGFESADQINEFAETYGLDVHSFHRRDGWQLWERKYVGTAVAYDLWGSEIGDYICYDKENFDVAEEFAALGFDFKTIEEARAYVDEAYSSEEESELDPKEIESATEYIELVKKEVDGLKDNEYYCVNTNEVKKKTAIEYYEDTHHYALGVLAPGLYD